MIYKIKRFSWFGKKDEPKYEPEFLGLIIKQGTGINKINLAKEIWNYEKDSWDYSPLKELYTENDYKKFEGNIKISKDEDDYMVELKNAPRGFGYWSVTLGKDGKIYNISYND